MSSDDIINKITALIQSITVKQDSETESAEIQNLEEFLLEYNLIQENIFSWLSESLIEGQYIIELYFRTNLNNVKSELEKFREVLLSLKGPINESNLDVDASDDDDSVDLSELIRPIFWCFDRVIVLMDQIDKRNKLEIHKPLFIVNDEDYNLVSTFSEAFKYARDINSLLIGLEYYDHFLTVDHNILKNLAYIQIRINDKCLINDKIKELMKVKCHVLIKKILLRLDEDKVFSYRYVHNYQDKELKDFKESLPSFKEIDDLIISHYKDDIETNTKSNIEEKARPILSKKDHELKCSDYQILSKYYKDKLKSQSKLTELRNRFQGHSKEENDSSYSFNICDQYLLNNSLSLSIDNNDHQHVLNTPVVRLMSS